MTLQTTGNTSSRQHILVDIRVREVFDAAWSALVCLLKDVRRENSRSQTSSCGYESLFSSEVTSIILSVTIVLIEFWSIEE